LRFGDFLILVFDVSGLGGFLDFGALGGFPVFECCNIGFWCFWNFWFWVLMMLLFLVLDFDGFGNLSVFFGVWIWYIVGLLSLCFLGFWCLCCVRV